MDKDRIAGSAKDFAGKVEGAAGKVTGDAQTEASGRILGLAVQILHRARGLAGAALDLGLSVACHIADSAFNFTGNILCRAGNSILVHRAHSFYASYAP